MMPEFKTVLKALRKEKKMVQRDLSHCLGYNYTAVSNYESGRNQPSIEDLITLAKTLGVSVDYLVGNSAYRQTAEELLDEGKMDLLRQVLNLDQEEQEFVEDFIGFLMSKREKESQRNQNAGKTKNETR